MAGDPDRGKEIFKESCSQCHKIGAMGHEVDPDLLSVTTRYQEVLLADILIPNQAVETGYEEYLMETVDGTSISGVMANEYAYHRDHSSRQGRRGHDFTQQCEDHVLPQPLAHAGRSRADISVEGMADLLAYIKSLRM